MNENRTKLVPALAATAVAGVVGVALLGGLALGQSSPAASGPSHPGTQLAADTSPSTSSGATITVTATGTVSGAPDTVSIDMGVTANGSTASGALDQANQEMSTLQSTFLRYVAKHNLQTSNLSLSPNYDSSGAISGYSADEELTITMHNIKLAGALIDAASHAVGNDTHINDISFSISDTSGLLSAARAQAMQNAQLEASELASGAGVSLGPIKSVTDQEQQQTPQPEVFGPVAAAKAAVPLQAGTQQLQVQVEVVYELSK